MTDIITDLCSHLNNSNDNTLMWIYEDKIDIFNKHTQYITYNEEYKPVTEETVVTDVTEETVVTDVTDVTDVTEETVVTDVTEVTEVTDVTDVTEETVVTDVTEVTEVTEENGILRPSLSTLLKEEKKYKKKGKIENVITPLELIMRECSSPNISKDYIKERIINLISQKEYIKVFGSKKSADTMSAFINNKWNKSILQFISFLFDKKIIYNKNEILYDKDNGTIII